MLYSCRPKLVAFLHRNMLWHFFLRRLQTLHRQRVLIGCLKFSFIWQHFTYIEACSQSVFVIINVYRAIVHCSLVSKGVAGLREGRGGSRGPDAT